MPNPANNDRLSRALTGVLLASAALVPGTLGLVVSRQISRARSNDFLPSPGYRVDVDVQAPWASGRPLRLAFLGDSLVEGVGAPLASQSLPGQTAYRLSAYLHRPVHMRSYGVASSRVEHVIDEQIPQLDEDVDYVLALIGANDATHGTPPWEHARELEEMIIRANARTKAPVILFGIPDIHSAPLLARPLKDMAALMGDTLHVVQRRVAERHPDARHIELRREVGHTFRRHAKDLFAADGYHPNPAGYALIAEATARALASLICEEEACAADESTVEMLETARADGVSHLRAVPQMAQHGSGSVQGTEVA